MRVNRSRAAWSLAVGLFLLGSAFTMVGGDTAGSATEEPQTAASPAGEVKGAEAKTAEAKSADAKEVKLEEVKPPVAGFRDTSGVACLSDPVVIEDIRKRREELDLKTKELAAKEVELKAREKALDEELKKLEAVRDDIAKAETISKKGNEEKVAKLVETVETMSPKAAAQMLTAMDETLAVATIARMSTPKLAKVMNLIEPGRASRFSEGLVGVARARKLLAQDSATAATTQSVKGGEKNDGHNESSASSASENPSDRKPNSEKGGKTGRDGV